MREQGSARGGHATPMCLRSLRRSPRLAWPTRRPRRPLRGCGPAAGDGGSETGAEAVSAAPRAAAEARSRYSRCSQRFSASNCQFQCRFLRSSPLAAAAVIIVRPRAFLLQAAAYRLSRAFMRRLQPRAATLTWPRVHATAGRHGLAGLVESVQVNVRIRGTGRK